MSDQPTTKKPELSFVIPAKDEEETVEELFIGIAQECNELGKSFEVIFIDDGSSDSTHQVMKEVEEKHPGHIHVIKFRSNRGKARALQVGFDAAQGEVIFTLDADLQDDPKEIGRFLQKLDEGYDLVSGWKKVRHDPWHKVLPSRVFNFVLSSLLRVKLHDHNCGFKCYRREVIKTVNLYGEMHRMVPSLASIHGFKSSEISVTHHPRRFGYSKYGVKRFLRGLMDMTTVYFLKFYSERPLHFMGGVSLIILGAAVVIGALGLGLSNSLPLVSSAASLLTASVSLFACGLIAELTVHQRENMAIASEEKASSLSDAKGASLPSISAPTSDRKAVLVCDDDPKILQLVTYHLKKAGYQVIEATNGEEALERFDENVGFVLVDLMMPKKDGLEVLRQLKAQHKQVPVAMMSAFGQVSQAVSAMKEGALDYVQKPFDPADIVRVTESALESLGTASNTQTNIH